MIYELPYSHELLVQPETLEQDAQLLTMPCAEPYNDNYYIVPWNTESRRYLNNIGLNSLDCFHTCLKIEGKYKPLAHQLTTASFITLNPRCFILSDCRLGKTGSAIVALHELQRMQDISGGILVITTVTTMRTVWEDAIRATLPGARIQIVHGPGRAEALQAESDWYLTNYDSVRLSLPAFQKAKLEGRIGCVLIDELTHVGHATSKRHKAIYSLVNNPQVDYVIGMTGTPGYAPEPVYGMARVVNPSRLPCRTLTEWRNLTEYQYGPMPYQRRPRTESAGIIHDTLQPAIRYRKEQVLDLPPVVFQQRRCELSKEQQVVIRQLRAEAVAFVQDHTVTAANAAVLLNKLLQAPLGFVIDEHKNVQSLPCTERDQLIVEAAGESTRKVVIFSMFKHRLKMLLKLFGKQAAVIDGSVGATERAVTLRRFRDDDSLRVLICHPTTVGFGTELSQADTMIFDGPPMLGDFSYTQSLERLSSPKQQSDKIAIIQIAGTKEEKKLFTTLDKGQTLGQSVATLFEMYRA